MILDICFKLPRGLVFGRQLRKEIKKWLNRGHIEIFCSYEDNREGASAIKIDPIAAKQYLEISYKLEEMGFVNDMSSSQVLRMPEVLITKGAEDDENIIEELAVEAADKALKELCQMREREGKQLKNDIKIKLDNIEVVLNKISQRAPIVSQENREKLRARIEDALNGIDFDEMRFANEVAYYADRTAIDEEIIRLKSHIAQGRRILEENQMAGRKLDFLVQEMNREVNTIGSKANDLEITNMILELKGEIEKIREQVQNIE